MSDLPVRPSLISLRKQAKSLLSGFKDADADAIAAVQEHHPKPDQFSSLRDAQLAIARKYEHQDWASLCAAVESAVDTARSLEDRADLFADLACLCYSQDESVHRRERAARLLEETPDLTGVSIYAAAAGGDVNSLREHLEKDASLANQVGGPRDWSPLMYVGYSRLPNPTGDAVGAMRLLLDNNADPRFYIDGNKGWGGWYWTALTGVIGEGESGDVQQSPHPHARELAVMLLDAGADPNDSQALYNCHFTPGTEWLELLLSYGLNAEAPANPANPSEETTLDYQLAAAVRRGYTDCVKLLLEHGANASGRDDRYTNRTFVENAVVSGHGDVFDLLVEHGATSPELTVADRFRFAIDAEDGVEARKLLEEDADVIDQPALMVGLASHDRQGAARLFVELGADPNRMNKNGRGPIHEAAWSGYREMIDLLLDLGARLDIRSDAHGGTAVGYANQAGRFELRDYLLSRSNDVQDLVTYNQVERLDAVLTEDPSRINTVRHDDGKSMVEVAREKDHPGVIEVLQRHGAAA